MKKNLIILITLALIVSVIGMFIYRDLKHKQAPAQTTTNPSESDSPAIVSTKPAALDGAIVSSTEVFEIVFNRSLENVGEFKVRIEPKIDFKLELSQDRKTGKIKPVKPLELGTTYTIFVGSDSKFDGAGAWGQTKTFQFKTIKYSGV